MKEISDIVKNFDERINLSSISLAEHFGLENGKEILSNYFNFVDIKKYEDELIINESQPLIDYILSCHGNQNEYLLNCLKDFKFYIDNLIKQSNGIKITKDAGLFICIK